MRPIVRFSILAASILPLLLLGDTGGAESPSIHELKNKIAEERKQLVRLKGRLEAQRERIARSEKAEQSILQEVEELDAQLELLAGEVRIRNYQWAMARQKLQQASDERERIERSVRSKEADLRLRIRALYKGMGTPPTLMAWLNSGVAEAARMRLYAHRVTQADARLIRTVQEERKKRERLLEVIRSETVALTEQKRKLEQEELRLRTVHEKKKRLLASIRRRRQNQRQVYRELEASAGELQRLLNQWVAKAEQLSNRTFADRKGLLPWPVPGRIIGRFDPVQQASASDLTHGTGISLEAEAGEPVRAVGEGRVIYADRLRGYGNLLVIDHGQSFYTVYAHGTVPIVRVGDMVEEGQAIARVGDGGALGRPAIYFEVRRHGLPQDPMAWLRVRVR